MNEKLQKNTESLVSIIIPVYNGSNYLKDAIDSAISQTYKNIEILVINDGSCDEGKTETLALSYGDQVRYLKKENGGVASALNLAIKEMNGSYFSWLSHDDMYHVDKIKEEMNVIQQQGDCIVCCNVTTVDSEGRTISNNYMSKRKFKSINCFLALDSEAGMNGCALLIPKTFFDTCGCFNVSCKYTQDYDLWYRMASRFTFKFIEKCLVFSRSHSEQDSKVKGDACAKEADQLHYEMLKNITINELISYEDNFEYYVNQYHVYYNAQYLKTASQIFLKVLNLYRVVNQENDYNRLFSELLELDTQEKVNKFIEEKDLFIRTRSMKNTIMMYSNVWTKGGIERVISIVLPRLAEKYNIILISNDVKHEEGFKIPDEVLHLKIGKCLGDKVTFSLLVLAQMLNVDFFVGHPNILMPLLELYPHLEACGIRTMLCNHGSYFLPCWNEYLYPILKKRNEIFSKVTVVTWPNTFNVYLGNIISENNLLLPNPNTYYEKQLFDERAREKIILCVGRFYDQIKRVDLILKMFRQLLEREADAKLYMVGGFDLKMPISYNGNKITLESYIKELNFQREDSIVWYGEREDISPFYKQASVNVVASESEGFCMVLNEAAVFGCPSVIFEIPGLEDIVLDGVNGVIIPQGDTDKMADVVYEFLEDKEYRNKLGANAQELSKRFSQDMVVEIWITVIDAIISNDNKKLIKIISNDKKNCDKELYYQKAVASYKKEIIKVNKFREQYYFKKNHDMELDISNEIDSIIKSNNDKNTVLNLLEKKLLKDVEEKLIFKNEIEIKLILKQLPLNNKNKTIGIFGTGVHTDKLLNNYLKIIGPIEANIVFIDTNLKSREHTYKGKDIYNVHDLKNTLIEEIIISSIKYEQEMYDTLQSLYGHNYFIYRFYEKRSGWLFT